MTTEFDTYINNLLSEKSNRYEHILQHLTPEQVEAGREWISECEWKDLEPEDIAHLSPLQIVKGVANNYEGGWEEFLRAE